MFTEGLVGLQMSKRDIGGEYCPALACHTRSYQ